MVEVLRKPIGVEVIKVYQVPLILNRTTIAQVVILIEVLKVAPVKQVTVNTRPLIKRLWVNNKSYLDRIPDKPVQLKKSNRALSVGPVRPCHIKNQSSWPVKTAVALRVPAAFSVPSLL